MSVTIHEIISTFPPLQFIGDDKMAINKVIQIDSDNKDNDILCWCNSKNVEKLIGLKAGTIIIPAELRLKKYYPDCNYIMVENPRKYFNDVLTAFFWKKDLKTGISGLAVISASATIGAEPFIASNVIIEENCIIGNNVRILNNTIIYPNTQIGDNVVIGANNVIGNYGFGYEKDDEGNHALMPHIGNVVINPNVEIGNNNCIDRAVLGSTIIGRNTKIHNFVQIAHGVRIGENCLITANVTISGSTTIGDNVWFGPGVIVSNKLKIGNSSYLSMGAVVFSDVPEQATIIGNPGRIIKVNSQ